MSVLLIFAVAPARPAEILNLGLGATPYDVNNAGQVVGQALFIGEGYSAALWPSSSTTPQGLGAGGGFPCPRASAINEAGQVTGCAGTGAFLWDDGVMTDLAPGSSNEGLDLNDAGQVVGDAVYGNPEDGYSHAVLWENGTMQDLGTFGGTRSSALSINASGQVLIEAFGFAETPTRRTFLWSDDNELQELKGVITPSDLNDVGQVVGYNQLAGVPTRAWLWQGGQALLMGRQDRATLPLDINNRGQVVGYSTPSGGSPTAFLWQNGRFLDLCALVDCAGQDWTLGRAEAINDRGDVVGTGVHTGSAAAFLIRGLSEPYAAGRYVTFADAAGTPLVARLRTPAASGPVSVQRVNSTSGVALANLSFFPAGGHSGRQVIALPNIGGSAAGDVAVLATRRNDGYSRVELRDGESGALIKTINVLSGVYIPVWLFEMPDIDNNDKVDLGLLAVRASDGRLAVKLVGSISGSGIGSLIPYSAGLTPVMAAALPDLDGSGTPEIAVLAEKPDTGRFLVEVRNASGATAPRKIYFTDGYDPVSFRIGPDTDGDTVLEVAVLMRRRSDRLSVVEMRNAVGAPAPHKVAFSAGYEAAGFTGIGSTDPDAAPEWVAALERVADRRPYAQLKNAYGPANPRTTPYHTSAFAVQHLLALPDTDGVGGPDIAVIAHRKTDGRVRVEIRNARGGGTTRAFFFTP